VGAAILILIVIVAWVVTRLAPLFGQPHLHRLARFHASLAADRQKVVVCVGDSLTQGNVSYDYVHVLASRLEPDGYTVLNAGVNGDLAWNVLQRIDAVTRGEPAYVVLLVGTNDARACESDRAATRYERRKALPQTPDGAFFEESYRGLLEALATSGCTRTILVTIPPLGERGDEPVVEAVGRVNAFIAREAAERELPCLDLHGALERQLDAGPRDRAPEYGARTSQRLMVRAVLLRYLLRWSWDRIARHHGMRLLSDMVHLDETGGGTLVDLVEQEVRSKSADDC
jgi:lysophospholipase L1-like esterase